MTLRLASLDSEERSGTVQQISTRRHTDYSSSSEGSTNPMLTMQRFMVKDSRDLSGPLYLTAFVFAFAAAFLIVLGALAYSLSTPIISAMTIFFVRYAAVSALTSVLLASVATIAAALRQ